LTKAFVSKVDGDDTNKAGSTLEATKNAPSSSSGSNSNSEKNDNYPPVAMLAERKLTILNISYGIKP